MKISLRSSYSWEFVVVEPNEQTYKPEFVMDIPYKDVLKILRVQVEMEQLQQRLKPLFEAAKERGRTNAETKTDKAKLERLEKEGETLPTSVSDDNSIKV